jgi:hypothetical protein
LDVIIKIEIKRSAHSLKGKIVHLKLLKNIFLDDFNRVWYYIEKFKNKIKIMILGGPSSDFKLTLFLILVSFIISFVVYVLSKKKLLSFFIFSALLNSLFITQSNLRSLIFKVYDLMWLKDFSLHYWPIINLILFIILIYLFLKNVFKKR